MQGQLLPEERKFLHDSVVEAKPKIVLEVGTWRGGGSTLQIVQALEKNGIGVLHTCEPDRGNWEMACEGYQGNPRAVCHCSKSDWLIKKLIDDGNIPDFIFFDGPEEPDCAVVDLNALMPHLKSGAIFMMHDWDQPSKKAEKIRPIMEASTDWKLVRKLTAPISVGLCKYVLSGK